MRGIVALEAGSGFVFPEDALPAPMPSAAGELAPEAIPADDFAKLTQIPIVIYYGDNIPDAPTAERGKVGASEAGVEREGGRAVRDEQGGKTLHADAPERPMWVQRAVITG